MAAIESTRTQAYGADASGFAGDAGSPLDQALVQWSAQTGHERIDAVLPTRIDVETTGAGLALTLMLQTASGARWWRSSGSRVAALDPNIDPALPMAPTLAGSVILSYRPGRRLAVSRAPEPVVEKGYRRGRFQAAAERHELAVELAGRIPGLVLPRVLERRIGSASLVLERVAGKPLRLDRASVTRYVAAGRALRAFQETAPSGLPIHAVEDELNVLAMWRDRVRLATGESDPRWTRALALAGQIGAALPEAEAVLAHRDLHDGQLLDQGDALVMLDFDQLARADRALDPGNLVAHLQLRALQAFPGADSATATDAVLALRAGLGRDTEPCFARRLAFYRGTCLLRLALVYRLRPRWYRLAPMLLEEGMRCLERAD